jgi:hypothetical protein
LLLHLDRDSQQVTGEVTANTMQSDPSPVIDRDLESDAAGNVGGSVAISSLRRFKVAGFVNTSRGRVETEVRQNVRFNNRQHFTIDASNYIQEIGQRTEVDSTTITRRGLIPIVSWQRFSYPLSLNFSLEFAADGSASQRTTVSHSFKQETLTPFFAGVVENTMKSTDTLDFNASGAFIGSRDGKASQHYSSFNTKGDRYTCSLTAENNALTSFSGGCKR